MNILALYNPVKMKPIRYLFAVILLLLIAAIPDAIKDSHK